MDIIKLIEEMEDILDEASTVPFSKKVMVEREELLSVLKDMRENLQKKSNKLNGLMLKRIELLMKLTENLKILELKLTKKQKK